MNFPPAEKLDSMETIQAFLDETPQGMFLLDRRGRVHLSNSSLEQKAERSKDEMQGQSYGEALGCIHILDHRDGCGYGSICGDCFLHKGIKQTLKTQEPTHEIEGTLALGRKDKGVIRPILKADVLPLTHQKRLYLVVSIVGTSEG